MVKKAKNKALVILFESIKNRMTEHPLTRHITYPLSITGMDIKHPNWLPSNYESISTLISTLQGYSCTPSPNWMHLKPVALEGEDCFRSTRARHHTAQNAGAYISRQCEPSLHQQTHPVQPNM